MRRFDAPRRSAPRDRPTLCRNGSPPESRSKPTEKLFSSIPLKSSSLKPKATMYHCGIGLPHIGCGSPFLSWRRYSSRTVLFGFIDPYLLTVCLWSRSSRCRQGHTGFVQRVEKSTQLHGPTRTILNRWQQPGSGPTFFLINRKINNQFAKVFEMKTALRCVPGMASECYSRSGHRRARLQSAAEKAIP
jgi:hypothetical protein